MDYYEFQKMVCDQLEIPYPVFELEHSPDKVYQAVIPARAEIPDALQLAYPAGTASSKTKNRTGWRIKLGKETDHNRETVGGTGLREGFSGVRKTETAT